MIKRTIILYVLLLMSQLLLAQEFGKSLLHDTDHTFDVLHRNDEFDSSQLIIYLPSLRFGLSQEGAQFSDFLVRSENNQLLIDPRQALQASEAENFNQLGGRIHGLGFALKKNTFTFSAGYGINYFANLSYPFEALNLFTIGNTFAFGQEIDFSFDALAQGFHKYSIGLQYSSGNISVAAQLSYLSGIADISMTENQLLIEVAPLFYGISFDNRFKINTSHLLQYSSLDDIIIDYSGNFNKSFVNNNQGYAMSLALTYSFDDDAELIFQLNDIGKINWKEEPINYSSDEKNSFGGLNILDIVGLGREVSYRDSIEQLINIKETTDSYSSTLPLSLSAAYKKPISDKWSLSIASSYAKIKEIQNYTIGASANYWLRNNIRAAASLTHSKYKPISLGLGGQIKLGPVLIHANTSNILSIANQIGDSYNYSSIGINLVL